MTLEYIVLGILLLLMGAIQTWLRHGPGSRDDEQEQAGGGRAAQSRGPASGSGRLAAPGRPEEIEDADEDDYDETPPAGRNEGGRLRSGRGWEAWTFILGPLGMVLGIVLIVLGVLGK